MRRYDRSHFPIGPSGGSAAGRVHRDTDRDTDRDTVSDTHRAAGRPADSAAGSTAGSAAGSVGALLSASRFAYESTVLDTRGAPLTGGAAASANALGATHTRAGRHAEALALFERAAAGARSLLGPDHVDTLVATGNVAVTHARLGSWHQAVPMLEAAVAARERVLGPDHPLALTARDALAVAYRSSGRLPEAIGEHLHVAQQRSRVLGPAHPDTLVSRLGLALARAETGDVAPAADHLVGALHDAEAADTDARVTVALRTVLADCLVALHRPDDALDQLNRAVGECEGRFGVDHPETAAVRAHRRRLSQLQPTAG